MTYPNDAFLSASEEAHYRAGREWSRIMRRWERANGPMTDSGAEACADAALAIVDDPPDELDRAFGRCVKNRNGRPCACRACDIPF